MASEEGTPRLRNEATFFGFVQCPTLVLYDRRLSHAQKLVYMVLLRYAGQERKCWPGVTRVAKGLNLGRRTIIDHIKALEKVGLITREIRPGHSNVYWIEDVDEVYGKNKLLHADVIEMLREAGEERLVETILVEREKALANGTLPMDEPDEEELELEDEEVGEVSTPVRSMETLFDATSSNQKKSKAAADKIKKKRLAQENDPNHKKAKLRSVDEDGEPVYNVNDVELEWRSAAQETWPDAPITYQPWSMKNKGIAKNLCKEYGAELVARAVGVIIRNWDEYAMRFDLDGFPNMKLVAAFADSWLPEISSGKTLVPKNKKRARVLAQGEHDDARGTKDGGLTFA